MAAVDMPTAAMNAAELKKVFSYHAPKGDQAKRYEAIREAAHTFALVVSVNTPASFEQNAAITRIREAVMWANAAVALNE